MFHCGNLNERANVLSHSETLSESLSFGVRVNPSPQSSPQGEEAWREDCHAELTRKLAEMKSMRNFLFLLGVSASLSERIGNFPLLEERARVRCLTSPQIKNNFVIAGDCEAIQPISNSKFVNKSTSSQSGEGVCRSERLEILRSSSADLLQSNGLSLRMTDAFDKSNKFRHPEQSEGSSIADCSTPHPSLLPKEKENTCGHAEHVSASLAERTGQFPSSREEGVWERVQLEEKSTPLSKLYLFAKCSKTIFLSHTARSLTRFSFASPVRLVSP